MSINRTLSAFSLTVPAIMLLTGCEPQNEAPEDTANRYTLAQLNSDKEVLAEMVERMKASDPTVTDAYFKINDRGDRTVVVTRSLPDGTVNAWEAPAYLVEDAYQKAENDPQATSADGSSNFLPIIGGLMAGYMLSNAFRPGIGQTSHMSQADHERRRTSSLATYTQAVGASSRNMVASGIRPPSYVQEKAAAAVGRSSGGSFSSTGARAGGYSAGG